MRLVHTNYDPISAELTGSSCLPFIAHSLDFKILDRRELHVHYRGTCIIPYLSACKSTLDQLRILSDV